MTSMCNFKGKLTKKKCYMHFYNNPATLTHENLIDCTENLLLEHDETGIRAILESSD